MERRIFLEKIAEAGGAILAGGSLLSCEKTENFSEKLRKPKYVPNLVINYNDHIQTICPKNEEQGIKDMRNLLENNAAEEMWAYLPQKKIWYEIGIRGKILNEGPIIFANIDEFSDLAKKNNNLTIYHIHPNSKFLDSKRQINDEDYRKMMKIISAVPGSNDIVQMIGCSLLSKMINPNSKVVSKICSSYGISDYQLTSKGIEYYQTIPPLELKNQVEMLTQQMFSLDPSQFLGENKENILNWAVMDQINLFTHMKNFLGKGYIKVNFSSHEQLDNQKYRFT
ncbi:MAG: hypothetical protein Q7S33_02045 [Nanoarchaeota archaeon]|nr:hypothetical protein [Nanoarchaeota archaeon]